MSARGKLLANEADKTRRPVVVADIAHMCVAGQHVAVHDTVVSAIDAGAACHVIGVIQVAGDIFQS